MEPTVYLRDCSKCQFEREQCGPSPPTKVTDPLWTLEELLDDGI